ncbi:hypothetical protein FOCC_FOCC012959 [Frankliniella occidentalis]|nr:hypothetical protein FOCC_FOCC012959 [Frankliniella occidentalis]
MHLQEVDVYPGIQLAKEECVNHIAKRMGTALRTAVTECKGKGGRKEGALTEDKINKLPPYYRRRRAILDNIPNVNTMSNAVMATLKHCFSTDAKPKHKLCPKGRKSCFYNKSKAKKEKNQTPCRDVPSFKSNCL